MKIAEILEFVERENQKNQLDILLGEHAFVLDTLVKENSLIFEKGQYFLNREAFTANMLEFLLRKNIQKYEVCSSTNEVAHRQLSTGWEGIVITEKQTQGKGRLGRSWDSEAGKNLLFSLAIGLPIPIDQVPKIPLLWSAQIAEALDLYVKWPNDIINDNDEKIGGILSSVHSYSAHESKLVVGIGINVNQDVFPGHLPAASSLRLSKGRFFSRTEILCDIIPRLETSWQDDFSLWRTRSRTLGRRVKIGKQSGIATGLREDGALLLDGQPVLTGDVELIAGSIE